MNRTEQAIANMTDDQLRALRSAQLQTQANALKQSSFLNTGLTTQFGAIDTKLATALLALPTMATADLKALDATVVLA